MKRSLCLTLVLWALTTASPLASPQQIDTDVYYKALQELNPDVDVPAGDVTQVIALDPSPVYSSAIAGATSGDLVKRGSCKPYEAGGGKPD